MIIKMTTRSKSNWRKKLKTSVYSWENK